MYQHRCTSLAVHPSGKQVAVSFNAHTLLIWTTCEWSDRVNTLFYGDIRRIVFCLMCVRARLESEETSTHQSLHLSLYLWLNIIENVAT
jgi:hypothetical protein